METETIAKNYKNFILRFNVDCEQEDPVWCLKTSKSWENLSSSPDNFQSELQYQIEKLNGDPYGLYLASGTFKKGSIKRVGDRTVGRTEENLKRILEIPLDADFLHFILHQEKAEEKKEIAELEKILHSQSDEKLSDILELYLKFIKEVLEKAKMPYSEIIRSGYGYHVKIFIEPKDQTRIKEIREFHKLLVSHLNQIAEFELFDRQCTDAGTRVTRMEGSYNLKNPDIPRLVSVVESNNQFLKLDYLIGLLPKRGNTTYSHSYSNGHSSLELKKEQIIKIVKPYWITTQRQKLAMYIAGFLSKAEIPLVDVEELIREIATDCNDEEISERMGAIRATFEKSKRGEEVKGYKGLAEILSPDDLETLTTLFSPQRKIKPLTVREIMALDTGKERFIVENIAMRGGITMISGDPGAGKTWLSMDIARCVILGVPLFDRLKTQKCKVAYFDQENPVEVLIDRIRLLRFPEEGCDFYPHRNIHIERDFENVREIAERADLLIFDSLIQFHDRNEDKAIEMKRVMSRFRRITTEYNCAVILIDQNRKRGQFERDPIYTARGSFQKIYDSDITIALRKVNPTERVLEWTKSRVVKEPSPIKFEIQEVGDRVHLVYKGEYDELELKSERARSLLPTILRENESPLPLEKIRIKLRERGIDVSEPTLRPILRDLEENKVIESETRERGKKFYFYPQGKECDKDWGWD